MPAANGYDTVLTGRLRKLAAGWRRADGKGVPSVEAVLVTGVLMIGLVPALVAARHTLDAGLANRGHAATAAANDRQASRVAPIALPTP